MNSTKYSCKVLITLIFLILSRNLTAQIDSTAFWANAIDESSSYNQAVKTEESIQGFYDRNSSFINLNNVNKILRSAAKSNFAKKVFFELFYFFEGRLKNTKLETEFTQFAIGLEHDKDFSKPEIKGQLYYYYGSFFFGLYELFYAEKYIDLFLRIGPNVLPDISKENSYLNAMTIKSLIYLKQHKFSESISLLNATLDSAQTKNNKAWVGITKGNIGNVYYEQGNYEEAINYLKEDCNSSMLTNEFGSALSAYLTLKNIYKKQGNQDLYKSCLDSAYQIYQIIIKDNVSNELYYLKDGLDIYNSLAEGYYLQKDYAKSSLFYKQANELNNKIDRKEKERLLKKTIQLVEIDKSLHQISELNKEISNKKQFLLLTVAFIIIAIGLLLVYMSFYGKLKNANKNLQEIKTIIGQQNIDLEKLNKEKDLLLSVICNDLQLVANKQHQMIQSISENKIAYTDLDKIVAMLLQNSSALIRTLEEISRQKESSKPFEKYI